MNRFIIDSLNTVDGEKSCTTLSPCRSDAFSISTAFCYHWFKTLNSEAQIKVVMRANASGTADACLGEAPPFIMRGDGG